MKELFIELRTSVIVTISLAVLLCGVYPIVVWALAQGFFPEKANGSSISWQGKPAGSALIAQGFKDPKYFHPRPSAAGYGYDATSSGGSNLGPTSKKLADAVGQRVADYRKENGLDPSTLIPSDAVTASASGLDPHISAQNAALQAPRVAAARGLSLKAVQERIREYTRPRDLGFLGEPRVHVLNLNLALDKTG
jgi:potassium-transporting ATPase KdpC subunit